jgi:hypothetical protein
MTETQAFDLTELVEWEARKNLPRARVQAWGIAALGLFLAAVGAYAGIIRPSHPTSTDVVEGVVVIVAGLAIAFSGWTYPRALQRKPNLLIVSDSSLSFGRKERPPLTELRWDEPGLKLVLQDGRELRAKLLDRDRFAIFSLVPGNSPRIPLTEDAFNSILSEVQRHGLTTKSQDFGGVKVTVVRRRPTN